MMASTRTGHVSPLEEGSAQQRRQKEPNASSSTAMPFVTTSDVLNSLNQTLADLSSSSSKQSAAGLPHFELQRRVGGATRKATEAETKAADCQSQLEQATVYVQEHCPTWRLRAAYAQSQRQAGNALYQAADYEAAINTYLTCLPALAASSSRQQQASNDDETERQMMFAKVLNNLAQSTLQLQWYGKTEQFCNEALDHLELSHTSSISNRSRDHPKNKKNKNAEEWSQQVSKLYFRRAKARRLRGDYRAARTDLRAARDWLSSGPGVVVPQNSNKNNNSGKQKKAQLIRQQQTAAIEKEWQLLQKAQEEGQRNQERQRVALQWAMTPHSPTTAGLRHRTPTTTTTTPPKEEKTVPTRRAYSTLRAPHHYHQRKEKETPSSNPTTTATDYYNYSPWTHYRVVMGQVAEKLLEWTGEDSEDEEYRKYLHRRYHSKTE